MAIQSTRIQLRRGTSEALTAVNEVLLAGEMCLETNTGKYKIGDGSTAWNNLEYAGGEAASSDTYVSSSSLEHETWTMTLDDDSVITKDVATWTSQG